MRSMRGRRPRLYRRAIETTRRKFAFTNLFFTTRECAAAAVIFSTYFLKLAVARRWGAPRAAVASLSSASSRSASCCASSGAPPSRRAASSACAIHRRSLSARRIAFPSETQWARYLLSFSRARPVCCFCERSQRLPQLFELRKRKGLVARGQIFLEGVERAVAGGVVAQDGGPLLDLGVFDADRGLELFFRAHHRVRGHLTEVTGEHRVAAALFDLLVGRRLARREGRAALGSALGGRRLEIELVFDQLDVAALRARPDGGRVALEVVVSARVD